MLRSYKGDSESYGSCGRQDERTKKGLCFLELTRNEMVKWGACGRAVSVDQHEGNDPQISSLIIKEEQEDDEETVTAASHVLRKLRKKRSLDIFHSKEAGAAKSPNKKQTSIHKKSKRENSISCKKENSVPCKKQNFVNRWSFERYKLAEKHMLDVMKAEGAMFEKPIPRPVLRAAARKHIGDTGLLDYLLKHIDGKVAPGGSERFRRCYNTEGVMEYWLESANLVKIKREAGVQDPSFIPPANWMHGGVGIRESVSDGEIMLLKGEIAKLKREMDELAMKNQKQHQSDLQDMQKELMKWRSKTDERLMEFSNSLSGIQDMCRELMSWKSRTEQQLVEISSSLGSMRAPTLCTTFSPVSETWEDWLESTNLDNIPLDDFAPWLGNTDLANVGQDDAAQKCSAPQTWLKQGDSPSKGLNCARELELLKEGMAKVKSNVQDLVPKSVEDAQASVTPDSSVTNNSKFDLDNPFVLFEEMLKELVKWKAKMEEQMLEIVNSVNNMQASKQCTSWSTKR